MRSILRTLVICASLTLTACTSILPDFDQQEPVKENPLITIQPTVHDGKVYIGNTTFYEIDKFTGKLINQQLLDSPLGAPPKINNSTAFLVSAKGIVYALADHQIKWKKKTNLKDIWLFQDKILAAASWEEVKVFDLVKGKSLWEYKFPFNPDEGTPPYQNGDRSNWDNLTSIDSVNGNLYFGDSHGQFTAFNERTGKRLWHNGTSSRTGIEAPLIENNLIYARQSDTGIVVFDVLTGKVLQIMPAGAGNRSSIEGFCMDANYIYTTGTITPKTFSLPSYIFAAATDKKSGKIIWMYKTKAEESLGNTESPFPPSLAGDRLLIPTHFGSLLAVNKNTGRALWKRPTADSEKIRIQNYIQVPSNNITLLYPKNIYQGIVYVQAINIKTGKELWKKSIFGDKDLPRIHDSMFDSNAVYVVSGVGEIEAIDLKTGSTKWKFSTKNVSTNRKAEASP